MPQQFNAKRTEEFHHIGRFGIKKRPGVAAATATLNP
jgi:hypothetical protein